MELKIYSHNGTLKLTVSPSSSSTVTEEVMGECSASVNFTHTEYVQLEVNDYIQIGSVRYKIKSQYRPTKEHTSKYVYQVKFWAPIHDAADALFLFTADGEMQSEFSYDASPREHLQMWVDNMNRNAGSAVWSIGTVISANNKTIEYKNMYCWDAAFGSNGIAAAFETEIWADGFVINLCKAERGERVSLGYMQGLTKLVPDENNEAKFFTRLYPLGSTRNIDAAKYGYSRLQLPSKIKYLDRNTELYGIKDGYEEAAFADIYPRFTGTVSAVRTVTKQNKSGRDYTVYFIKDDTIDFNPNDYDLPEHVKKVSFQTGDLAGRGNAEGSFEANWLQESKEWEIINVYPDEDTQVPGGVLIPKVGDTYIPWNFSMPTEYNTAAEKEFEAAVNIYLQNCSFDPTKYEGQTDRNYIEKNNISLFIGLNVQLISKEYFTPGTQDSRVIKVVRKLNDLSQATITCSDKTSHGWKAAVDDNLSDLKFRVSKQEDGSFDIIRSNEVKTPSDANVFSALKTLGMFLRKDKSDQTNFLLKFGEFIDSLIAGKGIGIFPDGRIQTDRLEVRGSMTVMDLIINELHAMAGDFGFTDFGKIEDVTEAGQSKDGNPMYLLKFEKELPTDVTNLDVNDVLLSIVNTLRVDPSHGTYYSSWFRPIQKYQDTNELLVVLYPDGEVPGARNFPPMAGFNVMRRGNAYVPDTLNGEPVNERARMWMLSSREGRMMFLDNVYKPKLEDYNYSLVLGKLPNLKVVDELDMTDKTGLYAETILCQHLHEIDWNGDVVCRRIDRGIWSAEIANDEAMAYRYISRKKKYPDGRFDFTQLEQHTVYENGCKWGCLVDKTKQQPCFGCTDWILLEGDVTYTIDFTSSNGWVFKRRSVHTIVSAILRCANEDVTDNICGAEGTTIEWERDSGDPASDKAWKPRVPMGGKPNQLELNNDDMGAMWIHGQTTKVIFTCTIARREPQKGSPGSRIKTVAKEELKIHL